MKRYRKRKRRYKKSFRIFRAFLVISIPAIMIYSMSVLLKIKDIELLGNVPYTKSELLDSIDVENGDNLITVNTVKIASNLLKNHVYIDQIQIIRDFPDVLRIELTEVTVLGTVYTGDTYYLIDINGKILEEITSKEADNYIKIYGIDLDSPVIGEIMKPVSDYKLESLLSIYNSFVSEGLTDNVLEINLEKMYDVKVIYTEKYELCFGSIEDISYKIRLLEEVLKKLTISDIGVIDLSSTSKARFIPGEVISYFAEPVVEEVVDEEILDDEELEDQDILENGE